MATQMLTGQGRATPAKAGSINARHIALDMGLLLLKAAQAGVLIGLVLAAAILLLS